MKYKGKFTGWGLRGRPFSRTEFKKSHVAKDKKFSYKRYLGAIARHPRALRR